jgi:hypothetical protein
MHDAATNSDTELRSEAVKPLADQSNHPPGVDIDAFGGARRIDDMAEELKHSLPTLSPAQLAAIADPLKRLAAVASHKAAAKDVKLRRLALRTGAQTLTSMLLWGLVVIGAWIGLFAAGVSVPAAPYMKALNEMNQAGMSLGSVLACGLMVILCSTFTNPGLLACLAALLGGVSRRAQGVVAPGTALAAEPQVPLTAVCAAAVVRGFFLYLVFLSGLLLLTTSAITKADQEQYVQLAGTVSVLSFVIGYDPDFFSKLMNRIDGWAKQRADQSDATPKKG